MGNCIPLSRPNKEIPLEDEKTPLRIVKMDGKVLECRASVLVKDLLSNFEGYRVGVSKKASQYLPPDYELRIGKVYYLLPYCDPTGRPVAVNPLDIDRGKHDNGGYKRRVKVVLTKQQLQELLSKNISIEEVLSELQRKEEHNTCSGTRWKPRLQTILEESEQLYKKKEFLFLKMSP